MLKSFKLWTGILVLVLSWGIISLTAQPTPLSSGGAGITGYTTLPGNCRVGQVAFKTSATTGVYFCLSTDNWTVASAGAGGGDAVTTGNLSQFASTTSAQLATLLSNETGTGVAVFGTDPTLSGLVTLPDTTSTSGQIYQGTTRLLHTYTCSGCDGYNLFLGGTAGNFTLDRDGGASTLASKNVGIGYLALDALTTGFNNTAVGVATLSGTTTGRSNVALGFASSVETTTGSNNTALGWGALHDATTADGNIGVGYGAGYKETGSEKLFIGYNNSATEAAGRTATIIYGIMHPTDRTEQLLTINARLGVYGPATSTSTLNITSLPTVDSGLTTGDVWNNNGVLMLTGTSAQILSFTDPAANTLIGWDNTDNTVVPFLLGGDFSYTHATTTIGLSGLFARSAPAATVSFAIENTSTAASANNATLDLAVDGENNTGVPEIRLTAHRGGASEATGYLGFNQTFSSFVFGGPWAAVDDFLFAGGASSILVWNGATADPGVSCISTAPATSRFGIVISCAGSSIDNLGLQITTLERRVHELEQLLRDRGVK